MGVAACAGADPRASLVAEDVRVVTFNVAGSWRVADPEMGPALATRLADAAADLIAVQECEDCAPLAALLPHLTMLPARGSNAVLYDPTRWTVIDDGLLTLGDDDDGWGPRTARWAHLAHREVALDVTFYATHWCVPIRRDDDACDTGRQLAYAAAIDAHAGARRPAIVAGDLNVFDGFATGPVMAQLAGQGWQDSIAVAGAPPIDTFAGNSWAPPGRIDYVLASPELGVTAAVIDDAPSPSDHRPVRATLRAE